MKLRVYKVAKTSNMCLSCLENYVEVLDESKLFYKVKTDEKTAEYLRKLGYILVSCDRNLKAQLHNVIEPLTGGEIDISWIAKATGIELAYNRGFNDYGIIIAILGTGCNIDVLPEYIKQRVKVIDFTGEGTQDDLNHGTSVTYIIGSLTKYAKIYHLKIIPKDCEVNEEKMMDAFEWAYWHSNIMSTSWDFGNVNTCEMYKNYNGLIKMITLRQPKLIWCASAGNSDGVSNKVGFPACSDYVIAVGATNYKDEIASFSSRGPFVCNGKKILKPDCASYGVGIKLLDANGEYKRGSGTSFSCPVVASACSVLYKYKKGWILDGDLINPHVKKQCWSNDYGYGALHLFVNAPKCGTNIVQTAELAMGVGAIAIFGIVGKEIFNSLRKGVKAT